MKVQEVQKKKCMAEKVLNLNQRLATFSGEVLIGNFIVATLIMAIFAWLSNP